MALSSAFAPVALRPEARKTVIKKVYLKNNENDFKR